jgi:hypothetical protein
MAANQAQNGWIARVLGVTPGAAALGSTDARRMWESARAIWFDASKRADAQLAALQGVLRASDDEELRQIADMGLNAVTGNHKVPLLAAIQDIDGSEQPDGGKIAKLRQIADGFIEHLASDLHVDAVDTNELGVTVRIADTLIPALEELDAALERWQRVAG